MRLTPARLSVLRSVRDWMESHAYPPAIRDLCAVTGYSSTCTVARHVDALVAGGFLSADPRVARSLTLTPWGLQTLEEYSEEPDTRENRVRTVTGDGLLRRKRLAKAGGVR